MERLHFWKMQSIGNDFPLIHPGDFAGNLNALAISICDRKFGVGGDGLLTLKKVEEGVLELRMFNPDGTEDFCGNGLRCAARHAVDLGWVTSEFHIRHLAEKVAVRVDGKTVTTVIGPANYAPSAVPHVGENEIFEPGMSSLTTGSTHTILPVGELPEEATFVEVSRALEVDPRFPDRTSVIWVQVMAPKNLKIRIWERGVGETLGCGTGSSAAAADYMRRTGQHGTIVVDNPGGTVRVTADQWNAPLALQGEAFTVFEGDLLV